MIESSCNSSLTMDSDRSTQLEEHKREEIDSEMHWRRDERSVEEYVKINLIIERHLEQLESQVSASTSKLQSFLQ